MTERERGEQVLVWIDVETTGLDPDEDVILEIAGRITDMRGDPIDGVPAFHAVRTHARYMDGLLERNPRVLEMHTASGLLDEMRAQRTFWVDQRRALVAWLGEHGKKGILAGYSVHFDRGFLREHIGEALELLHYRQLDVTSLDLACRAAGLGPIRDDAVRPVHRAMDDVDAALAAYRRFTRQQWVVA